MEMANFTPRPLYPLDGKLFGPQNLGMAAKRKVPAFSGIRTSVFQYFAS
jgi:hypothetical protein